ncbi:hypothetical protein [Mycobacterium xenopi]|uniref:hypothetical protein n=1 Tax=Mycobacterium xenopi TaxID=1789 RepID=UPI0005875600|nr:hypothetical protein [Mycobacterium xenopi]
MNVQGHQIFVDELARFADEAGEPRLTAMAQRIAAPLRVAVDGRRGVGRRTVARALAGAGIELAASAAADVSVRVVAEVVKPEDRDAVAAARQPVLVVLNKADLLGSAGGGRLAAARSHCARLSALAGATVEPMVGLLAVTAVHGLVRDSLWAAVQLLAAHPADLRSAEAFLASAHPVPRAERQRLVGTLDLFGLRLAVAAARRRSSPPQVHALLRGASCVDTVVKRIGAAGAEVRYRRVLDVFDELQAMAVGDQRIGDFLRRDDTVLARMAAAIDVIEAAGLHVEPGDDRAAQLRRAVKWQRHSRRPGPGLHRRCAADIARGSLRLWSQAGGAP